MHAVKAHRLVLGLTTTELGKLVGVSQAEISRIEHYLRSPNPTTRRQLAKVLGVSQEDLLRPTRLVVEFVE